MPDGKTRKGVGGRPAKDETTKLLAYVCSRLEQRSDPGFFADKLELDLKRAAIAAAASEQSWRPGQPPTWRGGPRNAVLRPWLLVLRPAQLGLERAHVELTLEDDANQDEQFTAAGAVDGVIAVRQPLTSDFLLVDVVYEEGGAAAMKRRLSELAVARQRWLGLERVDETPAVRTYRTLLRRRARAHKLHKRG